MAITNFNYSPRLIGLGGGVLASCMCAALDVHTHRGVDMCFLGAMTFDQHLSAKIALIILLLLISGKPCGFTECAVSNSRLAAIIDVMLNFWKTVS